MYGLNSDFEFEVTDFKGSENVVHHYQGGGCARTPFVKKTKLKTEPL